MEQHPPTQEESSCDQMGNEASSMNGVNFQATSTTRAAAIASTATTAMTTSNPTVTASSVQQQPAPSSSARMVLVEEKRETIPPRLAPPPVPPTNPPVVTAATKTIATFKPSTNSSNTTTNINSQYNGGSTASATIPQRKPIPNTKTASSTTPNSSKTTVATTAAAAAKKPPPTAWSGAAPTIPSRVPAPTTTLAQQQQMAVHAAHQQMAMAAHHQQQIAARAHQQQQMAVQQQTMAVQKRQQIAAQQQRTATARPRVVTAPPALQNVAARKTWQHPPRAAPLLEKARRTLIVDPLCIEEIPPPPDHHQLLHTQYATLPPPDALRIVPIPPKTIGGIQDQVHKMELSCSCRRSSTTTNNRPSTCLKKYCQCFSHGLFCGSLCACSATCHNTGAPEHGKGRTIALAKELAKDPNVFRKHFAPMAEAQKAHREVLADQSARAILRSSPPPNMSQLSPRPVPVPAQRNAQHKVQLPPSYYTIPLKDDNGLVVPGIAFSLTHPLHRKRKHSPKNKRPRTENFSSSESSSMPSTNGEQKKPIVTGGPPQVAKKTGLEVHWEQKEQESKHIFQLMRKELDATAEVGLSEASPDYAALQKRAQETTNAVREDVQGIQAAIDAAKVNIQALFYNSGKSKRGSMGHAGTTDNDVNMAGGSNGGDHASRTETDNDILQCHEQLPSIGDSESMNGTKQKDLTLFVAQDTALLLETTRIVKRYTRELAKRRLQQS